MSKGKGFLGTGIMRSIPVEMEGRKGKGGEWNGIGWDGMDEDGMSDVNQTADLILLELARTKHNLGELVTC